MDDGVEEGGAVVEGVGAAGVGPVQREEDLLGRALLQQQLCSATRPALSRAGERRSGWRIAARVRGGRVPFCWLKRKTEKARCGMPPGRIEGPSIRCTFFLVSGPTTLSSSSTRMQSSSSILTWSALNTCQRSG